MRAKSNRERERIQEKKIEISSEKRANRRIIVTAQHVTMFIKHPLNQYTLSMRKERKKGLPIKMLSLEQYMRWEARKNQMKKSV